MAINDATTRNQYTATASQTVFPYTFEIFVAGDIVVEQNGTVITAYTLSGVGNDAGGNVTLNTGATAGDIITIYRDMNYERLSDYADNGDFLADEINSDLDRLWAAIQQNETNTSAAIRPAISDSALNSTNTELAAVATRAGKVLGFDADGLLDYVSSQGVSGNFTSVSTTTAMKLLANPSVGDVAQPAEFSTGNGGGATYDAVLTSGVTPNGRDVLQSTSDPDISWVVRDHLVTSPRVLGWTESGGLDNYDIMSAYIQDARFGGLYTKIYSFEDFAVQWINNKKFPLAFYGDSTTDGATTTGHVASYITGDEAIFSSPITINTSPNSYPNKLDDWLNLIIPSANLAIYNAGFDSMSLANNFGNKAFHRVFYGFADGLNNVDYSDVKGICLSWGTSDSINLNDIDTILDSYEWKMELLIVECFERGVQPFINDPVLNFQRTGSLVNGRQNDQSITIIESINKKLRDKYNLEKLSIREALENYVEYGFEQETDFTEVLAADGVHPNDKGHATIASWITGKLHPIVKRFKGDEVYKFTAGNPYVVTLASEAGTDIWQTVDNAFVVTRTSFYYRFNPVVNDEFMYRFFVFCEKPMDLTYDMVSFGNDQKSDANTAKIEVTNYADISSKKAWLSADNQALKDIGQGAPWCAGSHQLVARLKVGLNQINVTAPSAVSTYTDQKLGFLRVEKRVEKDTIREAVASGFVTFDQIVQHKDIKRIESSASTAIQWSDEHFSRENFHFSKVGKTTKILFKANTLHNRNIYWGGNRAFRDFDCYNVIKFSGTAITVYRADATNLNSEVTTETLIGSAVSPIDLSTITTETNYLISVVHNATNNTDIIVQYTHLTTGVVTNLAVINVTTDQPYQSGYGVGAFKAAIDSLPMIITDINTEFSA